VLFFAHALPLSVSERLAQYDVKQAKAFCEQLTVKLDDIKRTNGSYPLDIFTIVDQHELPRLLQRHTFYGSDGKNFLLLVPNTRVILGEWTLTNERQTWQYSD
jgi:hypothetical protein